MNQKGETTLLGVLAILGVSLILTLSALELSRSFSLLKKRSELFLCVKETKGELNQFLHFMGKTNWALKNLNRASFIMMLIPGLQGTASNVKKMKKAIILLQNFKLVSYLKTINDLRQKGCPFEPNLAITPFKLSPLSGLERDPEERAILRKEKWRHYFILKPYGITLTVNAQEWEALNPQIIFEGSETLGKLSSFLP